MGGFGFVFRLLGNVCKGMRKWRRDFRCFLFVLVERCSVGLFFGFFGFGTRSEFIVIFVSFGRADVFLRGYCGCFFVSLV